jgi:hypothetical protein
MARTNKSQTHLDGDQVLKSIFNTEDSSITSSGFLVGKVGRKVELSLATTSIADDTEVYDFMESGTLLYQITLVYTDGTRETLLSAERTA